MSAIGWIEPIVDSETGVDHLGMRVAGENLYAQLLDFTTTVSWRPRYFSFLCWALREAYDEAGGARGADSKIWNAALRRYDYALMVASLLVDPDAQRIAGSRDVKKIVESLADDDELALVGNHLAAPNASLAIYAGPMSQLGLLQSAGSVHRPSPAGNVLADSFLTSLRLADPALSLKGARTLKVGTLRAIGEICGLSRLRLAAAQHHAVAAELSALQARVLDWGGFLGGSGPSAPRILSIGLLLAMHEGSGAAVDLNAFRSFVLGSERSDARFPAAFDRVRAHWRIYQAHAYVTFALEALLSVALLRGETLQLLHGDSLTVEMLTNDVVRSALSEDASNPCASWSSLSMDELVSLLRSPGAAHLDEPALHRRIVARRRRLSAAANSADATALLLVALTRVAELHHSNPTAWIGSTSVWRLPPAALVARFQDSATSKETVKQFIDGMLRDLVIKQHIHNALRKLEADPTRYTAKLHVDGDWVIVVGEHRPDMSTPRFDNAIRHLQDLDYLSEDSPPQLTQSGAELLARIRASGAE